MSLLIIYRASDRDWSFDDRVDDVRRHLLYEGVGRGLRHRGGREKANEGRLSSRFRVWRCGSG